MNIPIITVTNQPHRAQRLIDSAKKHGWDIHVLEVEWKGFGTKLIATYEYLKQHPEIKQFVFCDAHDVVVLGMPWEFEEKYPACYILCSTEKCLWPPILRPFESHYGKALDTSFIYPNSGCYYATRMAFMLQYDCYTPSYELDDQYWMNMSWLLNKGTQNQLIRLDCAQQIFNSHSFIAEGEYTYENGRVQIMGNEPIFIHLNGGTVDEKLNELL